MFKKQTQIIVAMLLVSSISIGAYAALKKSSFSNGEKIGTTYPIAEENIIEVIKQKLMEKEKSGELAKMQKEAQQRLNNAAFNLAPVEGLSKVEKAKVQLFEPRFTLQENLYDLENKIIATAGTTVNPLETAPIPFKMFFFDGTDESQIALAKKLSTQYGESFMPILTAGRWDKLSQELNRAVYFDQQGKMVASFKVTEVPSMVSQQDKMIRVESMKP